MLSGYVRCGKPKESLKLFREMWDFGVEPNAFTLSAAIKACSELGALQLGQCFHGMVLVRGFNPNCVIASTLMDMYGRNSVAENARRVFLELLVPDAICWTSVISAFTHCEQFEEAISFFHLMQRNCTSVYAADAFTFGSVLTAAGNLGRAKQGKQVHAKVMMAGFGGNVVVESSIVDMYGKCGLVEDSRRAFDQMPTKNSVTWCALLGGYCQSGDYKAVLTLFREMKKGGDHYSFGTVLRACAALAAVRHGKEVHCQFLRTGGWKDVIVESALVDFYAKCGYIDYAYQVFSKVTTKNLITWNAMIVGFAQNGRGNEALRIFGEMVKEGTRPDYISFVGVLFACSHVGLVDEGWRYFMSMVEDHGIKAGMEHINCMVDLLGRAGLLEEAEDLMKKSDFREDPSLCAALLGACTAHSNMRVAERAAKKMMELKPEYHLSYVLLTNVYRAVGRWNDALKIRKLMEARGIKKTPGKSWIEIKSNIDSPYLCCTDSGLFKKVSGSSIT